MTGALAWLARWRVGLHFPEVENGAGEAIRTPDINLGKVALYP